MGKVFEVFLTHNYSNTMRNYYQWKSLLERKLGSHIGSFSD